MAKGQLHVLPVVAWAASPSQASSSASAGTAMEAANVAVMFVAVLQKLNPTRFDDLSSTLPSDPPVAAMRTPGELCLQGCDLDQIHRNAGRTNGTRAQPSNLVEVASVGV